MRAAWWWIDRWRKSTAYTDMSAEQQGVYRNLLDELWLRGGLLPLSDKSLEQASGDAKAWKRCRKVVLERFIKTPSGYRNETHDEVARESVRRAEKQREYRRKRGNAAGNGPPAERGNGGGHVARSPSLLRLEEEEEVLPLPPQREITECSVPAALVHAEVDRVTARRASR